MDKKLNFYKNYIQTQNLPQHLQEAMHYTMKQENLIQQ